MRTRPQTNLAVLSKTLCIGVLALGICTACVFDEVPSQLVVDETCVHGLDGTEPVPLASGQICEPLVVDGSGSGGSDPHCPETTAVDGLDDDTGSSGLADDTTG